jgi:hypothetical protein
LKLNDDEPSSNISYNFTSRPYILDESYGAAQRTKWYVYWRLFFLSCSEMFNYDSGQGAGAGCRAPGARSSHLPASPHLEWFRP